MDALTRICKHAMNDINNQLRRYQEKLLLKQAFAADAVLDPLFYKAGDSKHATAIYDDLGKQYLGLLEFAKKLQQLIESSDDAAFTKEMEAFLKS